MIEEIERALLATVMFADLHPYPDMINAIELDEEAFTMHYHKIVVKVINAMKAKGIGISYELVSYYLIRNNLFSEAAFTAIGTATPIGSVDLLEHYQLAVRENLKRDVSRI